MRTAVDTNILVRLFTNDDERQSAAAQRLVEHSQVVVLHTVILETEWVLRNVYRFDSRMIDAAFSALLAKANIQISDERRLVSALELLRNGMDFADALHLAGSSECDEFVTFDQRFARRAKGAGSDVPVRLL